MSGQFKVGDICIVQNVRGPYANLNETECTVVEIRNPPHIFCGIEFPYAVHCEDGIQRWAEPHQLRKKPPKQSTDEWAESKVRELTKPVVQPVTEEVA
jgi:hypothetical protein